MPEMFPVIRPFIENDFHQSSTEQHTKEDGEAEIEDVVKLQAKLSAYTSEPEMDG